MTIPEAGDAVPSSVDGGGEPPMSNERSTAPRGDSPTKPGNRMLDWLLVREELARAQAEAAQLTPEQREFLRRARVALELGELVLAPGNAVRAGSTAPFAADLFRQAVYWALLTQRPSAAPISPEQLWAQTDREVLQPVAGNEGEYAYFAIAMRSSFIELADGTEEAQRAGALQLRRAATRLVGVAQRAQWRVEWAKLKRIARIALVVLIPALIAVALWPRQVDLARGVPWHTSSVGAECHPDKSECGGGRTDILFHTRLEQDPWFEYDFGTPVAFSALTVLNRSDCCQDRAVPLIAEVSNDDQSFKEIARHDAAFDVWKPKFATQHARYLRLRVARDSILHLEAVKVHP